MKVKVIKKFIDLDKGKGVREIGTILDINKTRFIQLTKHPLGPFVIEYKEEK